MFPIDLVYQIEWPPGVNGQAVFLHLTAHREQWAVSHNRSGHGQAIHLLSGNQRNDPPLSRRTPVGVHPM